MKKIMEFNARHPGKAITADTIFRSMRQHMKTTATMYHGITISKGMRAEVLRDLQDFEE